MVNKKRLAIILSAALVGTIAPVEITLGNNIIRDNQFVGERLQTTQGSLDIDSSIKDEVNQDQIIQDDAQQDNVVQDTTIQEDVTTNKEENTQSSSKPIKPVVNQGLAVQTTGAAMQTMNVVAPTMPKTLVTTDSALKFTFENDINGWYEAGSWDYTGTITLAHDLSVGDGALALGLDYSGSASSGWSEAKVGYTFGSSINFGEFNSFTCDVIYDPNKMTTGYFTLKLTAGSVDTNIDIVNVEDYGNGLKKVKVTIDLGTSSNTADAIILGIVGRGTDYTGNIYLDNIEFSKAEKQEAQALSFTFDADIDSWHDWGSWDYSGTIGLRHDMTVGDGALAVDVDYSADSNVGWSEVKVAHYDASGLDLSPYNTFTCDFIYDPSLMTQGSFQMKVQAGTVSENVALSEGEDYGNGLKKVPVTITYAKRDNITDNITIGIIGSNTDYKGTIYLDNVIFSEVVQEDADEDDGKHNFTFDENIKGWKPGGTYDYSSTFDMYHTTEIGDGALVMNVDYSQNSDSYWSQIDFTYNKTVGVDLKDYNKVTFDVIYNPNNRTKGSMKLCVYAGSIGGNAEVGNAVPFGDGLRKATVTIPFADDLQETIYGMSLSLVGVATDYKGEVYIDNVTFGKEAPNTNDGYSFTFDENIQGWYNNGSWDYKGDFFISHSDAVGDGALAMQLDYTKTSNSYWSQAGIFYRSSKPIDLRGYSNFTCDVIYDPIKDMTRGHLILQLNAGNFSAFRNIPIGEDYGDGLKKAKVTIWFKGEVLPEIIDNFSINIVASECNYSGTLYLDNMQFNLPFEEPEENVEPEEIILNTTGGGGGPTIIKEAGEGSITLINVDAAADQGVALQVAPVAKEMQAKIDAIIEQNDRFDLVCNKSGFTISNVTSGELTKVVLSVADTWVDDTKVVSLMKLVEDESGNMQAIPVGGIYDYEKGTLTAYVDAEGDYAIMYVDGLQKLSFAVGDRQVCKNDKYVQNDVKPLIVNNSTVVPLRFIAEAFGADIKWDNPNKEVTIILGDQELKLNAKTSLVEGGCMIRLGRTYVPIRYVAEKLGADVTWVQSEREVHIVKY